MKVGDRNWFVDVGLLNVHKVGGWESDDHEHLSVIIWQEEATREVFYLLIVLLIANCMIRLNSGNFRIFLNPANES